MLWLAAQGLRCCARPEVEARLEASRPEVGRLSGVLGRAKWSVCEMWVSIYVHLISQIHPKSSVPYDFSMGFYRERTIFPYL